ncbi:MAG TPA: helix-turn-helix transcriptional regulator [Niastella sp.]
MKKAIPVYDICTIDKNVHQDLLVERLETYLEKHYSNLHKPHRHTFYHLVLFTKGKGTHTIDFSQFKVKPYQIYFMAPGQVHSWHFAAPMQGYIIHFNAELFSTFLQRPDHVQQFHFFNGNSEDGVHNLPAQLHTKVHSLLESILKEMEQSQANLDMIRVLLLQLFILVDRSCENVKTRNIPPQKLLMLNQFRQLIDTHFRLLRLPKEYAELMYITPNYLNALCQDVAGKSAGELIRDRIVLEAKRFLTNADMDISEISYELNFQDNSYFTRFFKKSTGITPEVFRKKMT